MATETNNTVAATLADPQYKAGRKLIDDGRLEEAVNFFSGLLETRVQVLSGNEMSPALAPLYYEYGNSLLYNAEESGAVFGDAITDAEEKKRAMAIVEAQINGQAAAAAAAAAEGGESPPPPPAGAGGEDGEAEAGGAQAAPTPDQEAEEDLEIAWENLEMARRIYAELELTEEIRTAIAKVHLRLGDLNMVNGMYNEAADEFEKCLTHRLALPCRRSRGAADAHVRRAQALFYASTLEGADKDALVGQSLEQYRLAVGIFDVMLAALKEARAPAATAAAPSVDAASSPGKENSNSSGGGGSSGSSNGKGKGKGRGVEEPSPSPPNPPAAAAASAIDELEDVRDAIRETIDTMVSGKDMEALAEYKSGAGSTTVGFGDPSLASAFSGGSGGGSGSGAAAAVGEVTTVGFGAPSGAAVATGFGGASATGFGSSASAAAFAPPAVGGGPAPNVMVVKRKGRPAPKAAAVGAGAGEQPPAVVAGTGGAGKEAAASPKKAKGNNE